ncbi:MAG TPA: L,D-transpeptidase family protein [Pyrinomonadaceae bacterium]|jgi:D-alanyl-D-alanine dipeptidase|nr:L,D-transpeptidase family protein [Pyrinomonadaceae bacterium]
MSRLILLFVGCAILAVASAPIVAQDKTQRVKDESPLVRSQQLILVTTRDWDAVEGTLLRFERKDSKAEWQQIGEEIPVVVGRNGLGWGAGVNVLKGNGPVKKEGDGKAPAGVFRLSTAFGFAGKAPGLNMPYTSLTPTVECVDDVNSRRYNLIVDRNRVSNVDWVSSEKMRVVDGYRWGVVVDHNASPPVAGRGSCIFLHIWAGPEKGTAGCTAMEQPNLEAIVHWLDAKKNPLLVQLPEAEYTRLRSIWKLPAPMR